MMSALHPRLVRGAERVELRPDAFGQLLNWMALWWQPPGGTRPNSDPYGTAVKWNAMARNAQVLA